tara:strand:- start:198 stop:464 length:267 start_codon:yes stop_codon:yes gene_type:complete
MEKIIFFSLVIPIMVFVLYLGGRAIMNGFSAKEANKSQNEVAKTNNNENISTDNINMSDELSKLNDLREKGVLTEEEFNKAKNKLLNQ